MRFIAKFEPQAWINDYAVEVDAEGDTAWDCTAFVTNSDNAEYFDDDSRKEAAGEGFIDSDDVLMGDDAAPEWIRNWDGPFTIAVKSEEIEAGVRQGR